MLALQTSLLPRIKDIAENLAPRLIEIRRHIHAHPELSGQEYQTAAYVAGVLSSCGLQVEEAIGKTGVVGQLPGQGNRPSRFGNSCRYGCLTHSGTNTD